MPRLTEVTSAFTSGELAPSAFARMDLDKYAHGATCLRNVTIAPLGGAKARPGTRFVCETKYSQFTSRLVPFEPNEITAYMIEAGCEYLRFFKHNTPIQSNANLIQNGTFDADLTGWTLVAGTGGTPSWNAAFGGVAAVDNGPVAGTPSSMRQDVTVAANTPHAFSFRIVTYSVGAGSPTFRIRVGSTSAGSDLLNATLTATGTYSYTITSPTTTMSVTLEALSNTFPDQIHTSWDDVALTSGGPLEVVTPYNYGELTSLGHVQSADEQYWLHACNPTNKLQRYGDSCWKFVEVTFRPPPSVEYGARPATEVQAGALSGSGVTFTAFNGPTFLASDVGREIQIVSGANAGSRAGIKSVTNSLVAVANICIAFISTAVNCNGTWKISDSPRTGVTPAAKSPVGASTTLTLEAAGWRGVTFVTDTDCGRYARINGGTYEITCVTSTTVARATIRGEASSKSKAESGAWSLEEALWSTRRGFASTGDFKDDRLYLNAGHRFSGSQVNDYENHGGGILDDNAVLFAINSKTLAIIRHIVAGRQLQLFTVGGEYTVKADAVISPTDISIVPETSIGSSSVAPVVAGGATIFASRYGRTLHEYVVPKDQVSEAYASPDLLLLAEHLTALHGGITSLAFQRAPSPVLWATLDDGVMISCAYRREENVVAWTTHDTCGSFESVAVMPHPDGDREQVWVICQRLINGVTKRYVEYLDDSSLTYDQRMSDSSVVYSGAACSIMQGVSHLNGERVHVLADGVHVSDCVVANGLVGIATPATKIEVGLPFCREITMLPVKIVGDRRRVHGATVWTQDSCNVQVRSPHGQWSCLPAGVLVGPGVREHEVVGLSGDYRRTTLQIRQDAPLPFHLLEVVRYLDVGGH